MIPGKSRVPRWLSILIQCGLVFFIFLYPFLTLMNKLSSSFWSELFSSSTLYIVKQTLWMTGVSLLLVTVVALPLAVWLSRHRTPFSKYIQSGFQVMWILPNFVFAFLVVGVLKLFGVVELYSLRTVLVAWFLVALPFVTIGFTLALDDLDPREQEAMETLGATPRQRFWFYDFPKLKRAFASTLFHQLWFFLTSFSLVVLLGGGPPHETIEVSIYTSLKMDEVNNERAFAFVVWQILILCLVRLALNWNESKALPVGQEWRAAPSPKEKRWMGKLLLALLLLLVSTFFLVQDDGDLLSSLVTSLALSLLVSVFSIFFSIFLYRLRARLLAELAAWTSPLILSWLWWRAYAIGNFTIPSLLLCVAVQTVLFAPWVSRMIFPLLDRTRYSELQAAQSLGASPFRAWRLVEWPRLRADFRFIFAWIFGLSLAEVSSVILFSKGDFEPLAVWVQNQFSRYHLGDALKGTILMIIYSLFVLIFLGKSEGVKHGKNESSLRRI